MAKIYSKNNSLINQYKAKKKTLKGTLIALAISGGGFMLSFALNFSTGLISAAPVIALFFAALLASGITAAVVGGQVNAIRSGVEGEESLQQLIRMLPEGYYGISNAEIVYDGQKSEIDMIAIGPQGVFIIENKNQRGYISGDYENKRFYQRKFSARGNIYMKDFYNPVKQVGTHVYRLANFLRENRINVWISGVVYFSNPETSVSVTGSGPIKIFTAANRQELLGYIRQRNPKNTALLNEQDIKTIINTILK